MTRSRNTRPLRFRPPRRAPRILVRRPRLGFPHPLDPASVRALLEDLGPEATRGLRSIELVPGASRRLVFARLVVPGRILLFDQPHPPWTLPVEADTALLEEAGALVTTEPLARTITWPGETLGQFMLRRVLLHELGHH